MDPVGILCTLFPWGIVYGWMCVDVRFVMETFGCLMWDEGIHCEKPLH